MHIRVVIRKGALQPDTETIESNYYEGEVRQDMHIIREYLGKKGRFIG